MGSGQMVYGESMRVGGRAAARVLAVCVMCACGGAVVVGQAPVGPASTTDTQHLTIVAGIGEGVTAPGQRHTLTFDVTPKPRMHVYAPGKHDYQVIGVSLDPQPWLRIGAARYPPSEIHHFAPLNEFVEVYSKPFRLERDVTVLATPEARKQLAGQKTVTISGRLEYQACDDKLCYAPQSVPVQWKLELKATAHQR